MTTLPNLPYGAGNENPHHGIISNCYHTPVDGKTPPPLPEGLPTPEQDKTTSPKKEISFQDALKKFDKLQGHVDNHPIQESSKQLDGVDSKGQNGELNFPVIAELPENPGSVEHVDVALKPNVESVEKEFKESTEYQIAAENLGIFGSSEQPDPQSLAISNSQKYPVVGAKIETTGDSIATDQFVDQVPQSKDFIGTLASQESTPSSLEHNSSSPLSQDSPTAIVGQDVYDTKVSFSAGDRVGDQASGQVDNSRAINQNGFANQNNESTIANDSTLNSKLLQQNEVTSENIITGDSLRPVSIQNSEVAQGSSLSLDSAPATGTLNESTQLPLAQKTSNGVNTEPLPSDSLTLQPNSQQPNTVSLPLNPAPNTIQLSDSATSAETDTIPLDDPELSQESNNQSKRSIDQATNQVLTESQDNRTESDTTQSIDAETPQVVQQSGSASDRTQFQSQIANDEFSSTPQPDGPIDFESDLFQETTTFEHDAISQVTGQDQPRTVVNPSAPAVDISNNVVAENSANVSHGLNSTDSNATEFSASITEESKAYQSAQKAIVDQAAEAVRSQLDAQIQSAERWLTLELSPPELGQLTLRVEKTDTGISAQIFANSPQSQTILQSEQGQILATLSDHGIQLESLDVTSGDPSQETEQNHQQQNQSNSRGHSNGFKRNSQNIATQNSQSSDYILDIKV